MAKLIYDSDALIKFREYSLEAFAAIDLAVLEAADIPAVVQRDRNGETRERAWLLIRHEHLEEVRELLDGERDPESN